jgi:hypothetical protein
MQMDTHVVLLEEDDLCTYFTIEQSVDYFQVGLAANYRRLIAITPLITRGARSLQSLSHLLKCCRVNLPACITLAEYL